MPIRVALHHKTRYTYDRLVQLSPQVVRLRPAPHCRTPVTAYSLKIEPKPHFLNWQQDPFSNYLARIVFPDRVRSFTLEVDLVAEMTVINPFDFFLEPYAEKFPFRYEDSLERELTPFRAVRPAGPQLAAYLKVIDREIVERRGQRVIDFLVGINQKLQHDIKYLIRMEPGVQTSEETLKLASGSCRDSAWLLVEVLRHVGLAARFVSGYPDPVEARHQIARRRTRAINRFHRSPRLDGSVSAGRGLGRHGPDLGSVRGRRTPSAGGHARASLRGAGFRQCGPVRSHLYP